MTFRLLLSEDSKLNPSIVVEEEEEEIAAKDRRRGRRPRPPDCSAAEIFGRYSVRARSWILHGRDGPLSNSDRQLEGRALLELGETRGANVPRCKDVEPTPSPRLSFPPRNFRTSSRLDDAGLPPLSLSLSLSLSHRRYTHGAIETPCTDRYNGCSLHSPRPNRPSPVKFLHHACVSMIWSPLHTWVVHLRRSEFK